MELLEEMTLFDFKGVFLWYITPPLCRPLQSVDTVCTLYQSFQEGSNPRDRAAMAERRDSSGQTREATLLRPYPKHMSATERLRKVIQELVDTEKSYVKVRQWSFYIY